MSGEAVAMHEIRRVRHELRARLLTVAATEMLNPGMKRVHFRSPDLADFPSAGADDHVKLVLPQPDGSETRRDYTPRLFDRAAGTLAIDFALHGAGNAADGPATRWARTAQPGDTLAMRGPRGSMLVPHDFDWFLLVGDATALPAIGRRVEELPAGMRVATVVLLDELAEAQRFEARAAWSGSWVVRDAGADDAAAVCAAIDAVMPGDGEGYVWVAGEAGWMAAVRDHLQERHGHPAGWMRAAGYWVKGGPMED